MCVLFGFDDDFFFRGGEKKGKNKGKKGMKRSHKTDSLRSLCVLPQSEYCLICENIILLGYAM